MISDFVMKMENVWKVNEEPGYATYIPSTLVFVMAVEDGWLIDRIECILSDDGAGFYYLVSLKSPSGKQSVDLTLPTSALVEEVYQQQRISKPAA